MGETSNQGKGSLPLFRTRWKSKEDVVLTMESIDGSTPTLFLSREGLPTVEIPVEYIKALMEFAAYNPIASHKVSYMKDFSSPAKYGAVIDDAGSDGYYIIYGQNTLRDGTPFIQWSDPSDENKNNPEWSLTIQGLFWQSVATAKWDDQAGVRALVELMRNLEELYVQAALIYPDEMTRISTKVQHKKDVSEWRVTGLLGERLAGPKIEQKRRRSAPNTLQDTRSIDKFYYEKTSDGIRLIVAYAGGKEDSYCYDELAKKLEEESNSAYDLYATLYDAYEVLELLDPIKFAQPEGDETK